MSRALQYAKDYIPAHQRPFPATVVVDVGANVGFFGLLAAAQGHHVYMFEPGVRQSSCSVASSSSRSSSLLRAVPR